MEEFAKELTQILQEEAGPAVKIMRMEVLGVNDGLSQMLNLHIEGKIISKNFQLEEYYGEFLNGADITHIARNILNIFFRDNALLELESIAGKTDLYNFGMVKHRIFYKLLNRGKNSGYLRNKCCMGYLDLAACFYIMLESADGYIISLDIPLELCRKWEKPAIDLFSISMENMYREFPPEIISLQNILENYSPLLPAGSFSKMMNPPRTIGELEMYVMTNSMKLNGASSLLCMDALSDFARKKGTDEIIIFPSSIHELILLPKYADTDVKAEGCREIVENINATVVREDEVLSDNVYLYSKKQRKIQFFG